MHFEVILSGSRNFNCSDLFSVSLSPPRRIKPYFSESDGDSDTDAAEPIDYEKLPVLEPGPGEHKLQYTYCLWFKKGVVRRAQATKVDDDYSKSLHIIGRCASVEQWWSLYSHLVKPTSLKPCRELHLFKVSVHLWWSLKNPCSNWTVY